MKNNEDIQLFLQTRDSQLTSQIATQNRLGQCSANMKQSAAVAITGLIIFGLNSENTLKSETISLCLAILVALYFIDTHYAYRERIHRLAYFTLLNSNIELNLNTIIENAKTNYPFKRSIMIFSSFLFYGSLLLVVSFIALQICPNIFFKFTLTTSILGIALSILAKTFKTEIKDFLKSNNWLQ